MAETRIKKLSGQHGKIPSAILAQIITRHQKQGNNTCCNYLSYRPDGHFTVHIKQALAVVSAEKMKGEVVDLNC